MAIDRISNLRLNRLFLRAVLRNTRSLLFMNKNHSCFCENHIIVVYLQYDNEVPASAQAADLHYKKEDKGVTKHPLILLTNHLKPTIMNEEEELLYREMNPEDPWYMGPDANNKNTEEDEE